MHKASFEIDILGPKNSCYNKKIPNEVFFNFQLEFWNCFITFACLRNYNKIMHVINHVTLSNMTSKFTLPFRHFCLLTFGISVTVFLGQNFVLTFRSSLNRSAFEEFKRKENQFIVNTHPFFLLYSRSNSIKSQNVSSISN